MGNPNISKDLLHKILSGESDFKINHTWKIHNAVFNNPSLDAKFLSTYAGSRREELGHQGAIAILKHPNTDGETLHNLTVWLGSLARGTVDDGTAFSLAKNPKTLPKTLTLLHKGALKDRVGERSLGQHVVDKHQRNIDAIEAHPNFPKKENIHKNWKKHLKEQTTILGLSKKYNDLIQSINNKRVVIIFYEGDDTVSRGARAIEPVVVGPHNQSGNPVVRAWQVQGASDTPDNLPGWRMFRVDRISRMKITEEVFNTPRPEYDPLDDHIPNADARAQFGAALQERKKSRLKLAIYEQKVVKNFKQWRKFVKEAKSRKEKDLDIYGALKKVAKKKEQERFGTEKEKAYAQRGLEKGNKNYVENIRKILDNVGMVKIADFFDIDQGKLKIARGPEEMIDKNISVFTSVANEIPNDTPLKSNKITNLLGAGAYGVVFELDNGHALKLFSAGAGRAAEEELEWYEDMRNAQFKKSPRSSRSGELAVYDFGELKTSNWTVSWAEIGQVVPFAAWLNSQGANVMKGRAYFDHVTTLLSHLARTYNEHEMFHDIEPISKNPSDREKTEYIKDILGIIKEHLGLPDKPEHGYGPKMLGRILREVLEIALAGGDKFLYDQATFDIHAGNFGMHLKDHQPVVFDR